MSWLGPTPLIPSELEHHWDRAEKEANKVLHSNSRHENSCIYLVFTEPDA